jgi:CheY-like chemotaxis protein
LVASVVASIRPTAEIKTIGLKSDLDADAGPVNGDPERLRQVVESILGNAVKFTPPNGTVTVRLARDGDAVLTVSDTGRGIDPELLPHVFERFKQVDAATPRGRGGLGLGLAIASHLVELHGGRVRAESAGIGQGATFTVVLPVVTKASAPAAAQQLELAMPGRERLDGARVLIVEDDADTRELVATVLGQAGAVIFTASDVWDGIAMAPRVRPNVVVCDLAMPGQDGPALVREVKAWAAEAGVALAALALTADARAGDRDETVAVGYDLYLTKPVEPSELVRAIARLARR